MLDARILKAEYINFVCVLFKNRYLTELLKHGPTITVLILSASM